MLSIDRKIHDSARKIATEDRRTLSSVVEQALEVHIENWKKLKRRTAAA